jgi:hypothetical protein
MLAIDFAKLRNKHQYHPELPCSSPAPAPVLPSVPKPCASSTSKRKLYFASSSQQPLLQFTLLARAFQNTFVIKFHHRFRCYFVHVEGFSPCSTSLCRYKTFSTMQTNNINDTGMSIHIIHHIISSVTKASIVDIIPW